MSSQQNKSGNPLEDFHQDDVNTSAGNPTSYDILSKSCGSTPADLRKFAKIRRLTSTCQMHTNIVEYVTNSSNGKAITVENVFKVEREGEREPFDETYRLILWHGTKPAAVPGIIQTGFRMGTGGLFGGGIYFADRIAKSAGYVGKTSAGTAYFILAEVAPGKVYKSHHTHSDYKTAPTGFDCVKGMGTNIPTWKDNKHYLGAILPSGVTKQNTRHSQFDIAWNEYILYDPERIIIRFLVECKL